MEAYPHDLIYDLHYDRESPLFQSFNTTNKEFLTGWDRNLNNPQNTIYPDEIFNGIADMSKLNHKVKANNKKPFRLSTTIKNKFFCKPEYDHKVNNNSTQMVTELSPSYIMKNIDKNEGVTGKDIFFIKTNKAG